MREKVFITIFIIIISSLIPLLFFRGEKEVSILENRELRKFSNFNLDENFQDELEKTISDQFIFGQTIKEINGNIENLTSFFGKELFVFGFKNIEYVPVGDNLYNLYKTDHIVDKTVSFEEIKTSLDKFYDSLKYIDIDIDTFIYFIDTYPTLKIKNEIDDYFSKKELNYTSTSFIKTNKDILDFFYKTDHHWNYKGSYKGYKDVLNLLKIQDDIIIPKKTVCSDVQFNGSRARTLGNLSLCDDLCFYDFSLNDFKTLINRKERKYGNYDKYIQKEEEKIKAYNYYADLYGTDYAEIIYERVYEKENILIIANSFSNPINQLIAQHFQKTFIVDLRHYEKTFEKEFNIDEYIKNNKIDKVLFLGNYNLYTSGQFNIKEVN